MDEIKLTRLEALGFKVGTAQEFLGLTDEENAIVEMHLALSAAIRSRRKQRGIRDQSDGVERDAYRVEHRSEPHAIWREQEQTTYAQSDDRSR